MQHSGWPFWATEMCVYEANLKREVHNNGWNRACRCSFVCSNSAGWMDGTKLMRRPKTTTWLTSSVSEENRWSVLTTTFPIILLWENWKLSTPKQTAVNDPRRLWLLPVTGSLLFFKQIVKKPTRMQTFLSPCQSTRRLYKLPRLLALQVDLTLLCRLISQFHLFG